jgi:hypothetical protein
MAALEVQEGATTSLAGAVMEERQELQGRQVAFMDQGAEAAEALQAVGWDRAVTFWLKNFINNFYLIKEWHHAL